MTARLIDLAVAKEHLSRIDAFLTEPLLLIGGLAVNQYYQPRDSHDIDLLCTHAQSQRIVAELFPTSEWAIEDTHRDEYRPNFILTNKKDQYVVKFGPKITERAPYSYIHWDDVEKDTAPVRYRQITLDNIRV